MMKHVYKKIVVVICSLVFLFGSMFEPFTCAGFRPVRSFVVHAEEDPGTTTATHTGIAALIAILMASGIRFVGDYETVVQPAVTQLWNDFTTYTGNQITLAELGAGIAITQGYMRVSSSVNNAVNGFQNWYTNTFNVPNNGNVNITTSSGNVSYVQTSGVGTAMKLNTNRYLRFNVEPTARLVILKYQNYLYCVWCSTNSFTFGAVSTTSENYVPPSAVMTNSELFSNYYLGYTNVTATTFETSVPVVEIDNTSKQNLYTMGIYYTYGAGAVSDITMEGQTYELKDGYQLENDQAKLLDIAGLAALAAALGLALENVTDLVNDIPLIYGFPWAQDFPDIYADTPADTIPWVDTPTSVIPADTPEYVPTIPSDTDSYKILGLERVFPFSIPFDLYYLIKAFSATPETPHFTIGMYNPASRRMVTQEINLTQFESYAQIFRVFVTAMYILALILITRKLIRS